jgi:hypothetical protein
MSPVGSDVTSDRIDSGGAPGLLVRRVVRGAAVVNLSFVAEGKHAGALALKKTCFYFYKRFVNGFPITTVYDENKNCHR